MVWPIFGVFYHHCRNSLLLLLPVLCIRNGCKVWFNVSSENLHLYCFNYHFKYLDFKHQHHHPNRIMWLPLALFPRYIKFASHFERMASHLQHCNISKICIPFCVTCRTSCILLIMNLNFKFIGCTPVLHIE